MSPFKLSVAALLLWLGLGSPALAEKTSWVLLVVNEQRQLSEYFGLTDVDVLRALLEGDSDVPFITLERTFVLEDMKVMLMEDASHKGKRFGFGPKTRLRADSIVRVLELEQEYISARVADAIQNKGESVD